MKVLISDDEYHVIQAIRLLVPWEKLGIDQLFFASSGTEALEIIRCEIPEIVITDIVMEDKSGIDIMSVISSQYPSIKVIAVSGHNDFEYVRAMLTKGCLDYLLKPLETATLLATVQRAIKSWKEEHETTLRQLHLQERMHTLSTSYSGVLLYKMLNAKDWKIAYQELIKADTRFSSVTACKIIYYDTSYYPMQNSGFLCLLASFEEQVQQLLQAGGGLMLPNSDRRGETVLLLCEPAELTATSVIKAAQVFFFNKPYPFHIGTSKEQVFPHQFSTAYNQAKRAFLSFHVDTASSATVIAGASIINKQPTTLDCNRLKQLEEQILSALLLENKKEIESRITVWLAYVLPEKDVSLYHIQYVTETFCRLFKQWIPHDPMEKALLYEHLTDENFIFSRKKLHQAIISELYNAIEVHKENRSTTDIMCQISQYMEINYTKPFIQSEYANLFYLNKDYMSRKFTSTFGVNMLTYLNQIRIRHAKELLGDFSLKIQEVAYTIGFKDEKYFAKQFKKLTNVTPGDYRSSLKKKKNTD